MVDKEQIIKDGGASGISAYKLLESELKGTIEDVGFYFKNDSCTILKALDLLLLTQGYRRFSGGSTHIHLNDLKYLPERSFDVTGRLELRGKSITNQKFDYRELGVTLFCPFENPYFELSNPDSSGRFSFQVPIQYGLPLSLIKASYPKGKTFRGNIPKGKVFRGDIMLDESPASPTFASILTSSVNINAPAFEYVKQLQTVKKAEQLKTDNDASMHMTLPEFTITGKDKRWYERFEEEASKIADLDSLDPTGRKYENLNDLLIQKFGAYKIKLKSLMEILTGHSMGPKLETVAIKGGIPIYIINGQPYLNGGENIDLYHSV